MTWRHIEISVELEKFAPKLNQVFNEMGSRYPDDYHSDEDWETESQSENGSYEMEESNSGKYWEIICIISVCSDFWLSTQQNLLPNFNQILQTLWLTKLLDFCCIRFSI